MFIYFTSLKEKKTVKYALEDMNIMCFQHKRNPFRSKITLIKFVQTAMELLSQSR